MCTNKRTYRIGIDVPMGTSVETDLKDKIILAVFLGGIWVEDYKLTNVSGYAYNPNTGKFDFSSMGGSLIEGVLNIIYKSCRC